MRQKDSGYTGAGNKNLYEGKQERIIAIARLVKEVIEGMT